MSFKSQKLWVQSHSFSFVDHSTTEAVTFFFSTCKWSKDHFELTSNVIYLCCEITLKCFPSPLWLSILLGRFGCWDDISKFASRKPISFLSPLQWARMRFLSYIDDNAFPLKWALMPNRLMQSFASSTCIRPLRQQKLGSLSQRCCLHHLLIAQICISHWGCSKHSLVEEPIKSKKEFLVTDHCWQWKLKNLSTSPPCCSCLKVCLSEINNILSEVKSFEGQNKTPSVSTKE